MILVYLRTYPEGSQLWDLAIGPGAEWHYSGSLSLDKAAVVPAELAGLSLPWLVVGVRNAQGWIFAEKLLTDAFLRDNVVYGFHWGGAGWEGGYFVLEGLLAPPPPAEAPPEIPLLERTVDQYLALVCLKPQGMPSGKDNQYGFGLPFGPAIVQVVGVKPALDLSSVLAGFVAVSMMGMVAKAVK